MMVSLFVLIPSKMALASDSSDILKHGLNWEVLFEDMQGQLIKNN